VGSWGSEGVKQVIFGMVIARTHTYMCDVVGNVIQGYFVGYICIYTYIHICFWIGNCVLFE